MFQKFSVTLSEREYRRIQRYALTMGASIDQAADYVVGEWMTSTGDRIVRAQETKERMTAGKLRLKLVYRKTGTEGLRDCGTERHESVVGDQKDRD
jgi:hypothetical protein